MEAHKYRLKGARQVFRGKAEKSVSAPAGTMDDVSLLQVGEAKGHGIFIDEKSLVTALVALEDANLPAHITHAGATTDDRMLMQVGYFTEFYVEDGKLKAKQFTALKSFREDEPERYNRLFDLAAEMPDAFGLSLVFEANIVMVMEDGTEVPVAEYGGEGAIREAPSVRFVSIESADFVDAPAANEDGLFSQHRKKSVIMSEPTETETVEEPVELEEAAVGDEPTVEDEAEPESETPAEDEDEAEPEVDVAEALAALAARIQELEDKLSASEETAAAAEKENEQLRKGLDGAEPIAFADAPTQGHNLLKTFADATGVGQAQIWAKHKSDIIAQHAIQRSTRGES